MFARDVGLRGRAVAVLMSASVLLALSACAPRMASSARTTPSSPSGASQGSSGNFAVTLESWDPRLGAAHMRLLVSPTAESHRQVALEYRRLGVLDQALDHFESALEVDPHDAAAFDGQARVWRDWGFPRVAFGYAQRATALAPSSPEPANTLGTIYMAIGEMPMAVEWYQRALANDPTAWYALNNLCYAAVLLGRPGAVSSCTEALVLSPDSTATRNNLALAYAAEGDLNRARMQFASQGDAAAHYNMGIVHMALGQYDRAKAAFTAALASEPNFPHAAERVRQSQALLASKRNRP